MYEVSFENIEQFLNYEVRLKFCDDTDNDAKGFTIAEFFVVGKKDTLVRESNMQFHADWT